MGHRSKFVIAGKGLTSWLSCVMFYCVFVTLLCGVLGHVWYLIVMIPDLCSLLTLMYIVSMSLKIVFIFITNVQTLMKSCFFSILSLSSLFA